MKSARCSACSRRQRHASGRCPDCRKAADRRLAPVEAEWLRAFRLDASDVSHLAAARAALDDGRRAHALGMALWATNTPNPDAVVKGLRLALGHLIDGWRAPQQGG